MLTKVLRTTAALAVAVTCAVIAPAANAMTIRAGDPELSGRIAISVPIVVSCSPFDPALTHFSGGVTVSVQQAAGRQIASGSGSVFGSSVTSSLPFTCDGTEQTVPVTVLANTSGPPFHGGRAVLSASANASAGEPCFPGSTGCFINIVGQSAGTGAVVVRL
jgi:hypothetical protein